MPTVKVFLKQARAAAGLSQEELARRIGISRQAYSAIEAERAVPSTEVALKLAQALHASVDTLFSLVDGATGGVEAELVGDAAMASGDIRVRVAQVGDRLLAKPLTGRGASIHVLPEAEGTAVVQKSAQTISVTLFDQAVLTVPALVMVGCDPSVVLLAPALRERGVRLVSTEEGSEASLRALARGEAHAAGCHLWDEPTGQYNAPWVKRLVPFRCTVVRFAVWKQGLILGRGNPKRIVGVSDLVRKDVTLINRQEGSGSRALLDRLLTRERISPRSVRGYRRSVHGHLAVAEVVAAGLADTGIAVEAAAKAAGLDFVPLDEEQYDLVIPNQFLDSFPVRVLLETLRRPGLRRQVEALGGYDAVCMGQLAGL